MSDSKTTAQSSGIGVLGALGVAFVVLKLTNYIDWSWWYVTLPFWGGLALALLIFLTAFLVFAFKEWFRIKNLRQKKIRLKD